MVCNTAIESHLYLPNMHIEIRYNMCTLIFMTVVRMQTPVQTSFTIMLTLNVQRCEEYFKGTRGTRRIFRPKKKISYLYFKNESRSVGWTDDFWDYTWTKPTLPLQHLSVFISLAFSLTVCVEVFTHWTSVYFLSALWSVRPFARLSMTPIYRYLFTYNTQRTRVDTLNDWYFV